MLNVPLSNIQMELLKLYSTNLEENDLKQIKAFLSKYFSKRAIFETDKLWEKKKYSDDEMDKWLNEK